jgi:hypothetical protein
LIMMSADKAERVILMILCLIVLVPVAIAALAHIMRLEARRGYLVCQGVVTRSLRRSRRAF